MQIYCMMVYVFNAKYEGLQTLRPVSARENKHGTGLDRNKIETAYGLSVLIFCSSLNL